MEEKQYCPSCNSKLTGIKDNTPQTNISSFSDSGKISSINLVQSKFCPECGSPLAKEISKFCDKCGATISSSNSSKQKELDQEKVKTGGQSLTVEFIFGLLGGIIGFSITFAIWVILSLGDILFSSNAGSTVVREAPWAMGFSIIGIIGAAIVKSRTKISGYLMIISAIGGLIIAGWFYILPFFLLIIAGIMAVRHKDY